MPEKKHSGKYGQYIQFFLTCTDLLLVNALLFSVLCIFRDSLPSGSNMVWLVCNAAYIPVVIWQTKTLYRIRAIVMDRIVVRSFQSVGLHALFFLSTLQLIGLSFPLLFYVVFYAALFVLMPLLWTVEHYAIKRMRRGGRNYVRVVIVGSNRTARRLYDEMVSDRGYGYCVLGYFDDEIKEKFDVKYLGKIDRLEDYMANNSVDEIFFTLSGEAAESVTRVAKIADDHVCAFYYVPQITKYVNSGFELHTLGAMPVLTLRHNPLNRPLNRAIKRSFDILFSSAFLIVSPIIFIPVAIAIKCSSPGPVFFKQKRTGYLGRSFNCLKFRTMRVNNNADNIQATKDDPRKTRLGEFLRHTSLDELPQFINVFLGDMSVVGPRPHMLKHTQDYTRIIDQYMVRHVVKPGITGWAQVNGYRGITDEVWKMEKRVEFDVWYIEHWHFFLDLKIIVRTLMNAVHGEKNAF